MAENKFKCVLSRRWSFEDNSAFRKYDDQQKSAFQDETVFTVVNQGKISLKQSFWRKFGKSWKLPPRSGREKVRNIWRAGKNLVDLEKKNGEDEECWQRLWLWQQPLTQWKLRCWSKLMLDMSQKKLHDTNSSLHFPDTHAHRIPGTS